MDNLEEITLRLAWIIDELAALPEGPSPDRFRLLKEQDALRARAAEAAVEIDADRSTASLESELAALKRQRRVLANSRGGYVMGGGVESAGRVGAAFTALHGREASDSGLGRLNVRISHIEDELASRNARQ